jgi:hypothetical protein
LFPAANIAKCAGGKREAIIIESETSDRLKSALDALIVFFEPVLVVPVAAVAGVVGLVLAIVTSPIWLIILWFAYKKHLKDTRDLAEHPSVREAMVSAPASLAANGARF